NLSCRKCERVPIQNSIRASLDPLAVANLRSIGWNEHRSVPGGRLIRNVTRSRGREASLGRLAANGPSRTCETTPRGGRSGSAGRRPEEWPRLGRACVAPPDGGVASPSPTRDASGTGGSTPGTESKSETIRFHSRRSHDRDTRVEWIQWVARRRRSAMGNVQRCGAPGCPYNPRWLPPRQTCDRDRERDSAEPYLRERFAELL